MWILKMRAPQAKIFKFLKSFISKRENGWRMNWPSPKKYSPTLLIGQIYPLPPEIKNILTSPKNSKFQNSDSRPNLSRVCILWETDTKTVLLFEVFTTDSFFIIQQSFPVFLIDKLDYCPFIVTSTILWERDSVTSLNISSLQIYYWFFVYFNHGILRIFIRDAVRYAWGSYVIPLATLLPFTLIFFLNLLSSPLTCCLYFVQ